jgi:uncharacterized protein
MTTEARDPLAVLQAEMDSQRIGRVIRGSLLEGLEARLDDDVSVEDVRVGRFVVVEGSHNRFFSAVHNVKLANTNEDVLLRPPDDGFVREILRGTNTYATIDLRPKLLLDLTEGGVRPVKTIPAHFATVREASDEDVSTVFGSPDLTSVPIGNPLEMTSEVCLDLERFVERSNAVFGKTGTGKSFLTRMLLGGVISSELASVLVFDMHNEYGMWSEDEESKKKAPALKQIFGQKVLIFSVDPASSRRRSVTPDYEVQVAISDIEVADLVLLRKELGLSDAQIRDMDALAERWGDGWLVTLMAHHDAGTLEEELESMPSVHAQSVKALARNLKKVTRLAFVKEAVTDKSADRMIEALLARRHVVIEFGGRTDFLSYMLVSSIVTRRIHQRWRQEKEKASAEGKVAHPPQLVITLEEAHKFLSPEAANQTIFGTIAREMRKYNVTLLVVDQRPSGIDEEIRSQLGTRVVGSLDDDRDQAAVLEGVPDSKALRVLLNNLEPKKQVLLGGYALPMPIVVETRDYYLFASELKKGRSGTSSSDVDLWER